jgi:GxxExxY protein
MDNYIFKDECYNLIGACMEVHTTLGAGFLEAVNNEALVMEFNKREIPFVPDKKLDVFMKEKS